MDEWSDDKRLEMVQQTLSPLLSVTSNCQSWTSYFSSFCGPSLAVSSRITGSCFFFDRLIVNHWVVIPFLGFYVTAVEREKEEFL